MARPTARFTAPRLKFLFGTLKLSGEVDKPGEVQNIVNRIVRETHQARTKVVPYRTLDSIFSEIENKMAKADIGKAKLSSFEKCQIISSIIKNDLFICPTPAAVIRTPEEEEASVPIIPKWTIDREYVADIRVDWEKVLKREIPGFVSETLKNALAAQLAPIKRRSLIPMNRLTKNVQVAFFRDLQHEKGVEYKIPLDREGKPAGLLAGLQQAKLRSDYEKAMLAKTDDYKLSVARAKDTISKVVTAIRTIKTEEKAEPIYYKTKTKAVKAPDEPLSMVKHPDFFAVGMKCAGCDDNTGCFGLDVTKYSDEELLKEVEIRTLAQLIRSCGQVEPAASKYGLGAADIKDAERSADLMEEEEKRIREAKKQYKKEVEKKLEEAGDVEYSMDELIRLGQLIIKEKGGK